MATTWRRAGWIGALALLSVVGGAAAPAGADEGGGGHYQPGYAGFMFGILPAERGFYFANYQRQYSGSRRGDQPLEIGGRVRFGVVNYAFLELPSCLYMTGRQFLNGNLGMAMAVPMSYVDVVKPSAAGPFVAVQEQRNFNLGDVYFAPVVLGWDRGNLHYAAYLGVFAPTGDWKVGQLAPTGKNFWTFEPGLGFTYFRPESGWEVSSYVALDFNSRNQTIDYKSGDDFHIDITIAKHVLRSVLAPQNQVALAGLQRLATGGEAEKEPPAAPADPGNGDPAPTARPRAARPVLMDVAPGIAFFCYWQLTGDSGADAQLGPFMGRAFGLGPSIRCVANFGQTPVTFQMRILKEFAVQNRLEGISSWFVTSLKL